jgi:E3 ubiquitin-protein ligase synoviolin
MARLRAQHMANQPAAGGFQHQAHFAPTQEVLHGASSRAMSNGHPNLPQGMVLPEGWTLMPLNRQEGTAPAAIPTAVNAQPNAPEASTVETPAHAQSSIIPPTASEATSLPPTEPSAGPTDERGSPLFVPTVPADSQPTQPEIQSPTPTRTQNPDNTSASPSAEPTNGSRSV